MYVTNLADILYLLGLITSELFDFIHEKQLIGGVFVALIILILFLSGIYILGLTRDPWL